MIKDSLWVNYIHISFNLKIRNICHIKIEMLGNLYKTLDENINI